MAQTFRFKLPVQIPDRGVLTSGMPQANFPLKLPDVDIRPDFKVRCVVEIDIFGQATKNTMADYQHSGNSEHVRPQTQLQVLLARWGTRYLRDSTAEGKREPFRDAAPRFMEILEVIPDHGSTFRVTFASPEAASIMDRAKSFSFGVEGEFEASLTTQLEDIAILRHAVLISGAPNARTAVSEGFLFGLFRTIRTEACQDGKRPLFFYGSKGDIISSAQVSPENVKELFWTLRGVSMLSVTQRQPAPRENTTAGIRMLISAANAPTQLALLIHSTRNKGYLLNNTTLYRMASTTFSTVGPSDFLAPISGRDQPAKARYLHRVDACRSNTDHASTL